MCDVSKAKAKDQEGRLLSSSLWSDVVAAIPRTIRAKGPNQQTHQSRSEPNGHTICRARCVPSWATGGGEGWLLGPQGKVQAGHQPSGKGKNNNSLFKTPFTTMAFRRSLHHTTLAIYLKTCDDYHISINSLTGPHAPMGPRLYLGGDGRIWKRFCFTRKFLHLCVVDMWRTIR